MDWILLLVIPAAIGALLGAVIPIRIRFLIAPAIIIAGCYWLIVGWLDDGHDIGKLTLVVITGIYALIFIGSWTAAALTARKVRATGR
jgi:hypothetical protein